jgi:translation initiation factor 4A
MTTNNNNNIITFDDMNLKNKLLRGIYAYGFEMPSEVQKKAIIPVIEGNECIIQAQSGTGKTATFSISILQRVDETEKTCQALVLSPTRELARQTTNVIKSLGNYLDVNVYTCIGGRRTDNNDLEIEEGQIIVGTPGRIFDMIKRGRLNLKTLKMFVLDEADEMLSNEFKEQIYNIIQYLSDEVQIAIYSATMPPEVLNITTKFMIDPLKILVRRENVALDALKQFYVKLDQECHKFDVICDIYNILTINQSIIFCNSKNKAIWLAEEMIKNNFTVSLIHGGLEQDERNIIISQFRSGQTRVLISTDLLSRGLDIHGISLVINYDLPSDKENYIHRVGRTCRYGKNGVSINLVLHKDMRWMNVIERHYNIKIESMPSDIDKYV